MPVPAGGDSAEPPGLAEVKVYLGTTSWSDDVIAAALDAETQAQADVCYIPDDYPSSLGEALKRRVARNLSMRRIPLAVLQGDAELGSSTVLPGNDPEIRRFERPYRKLLVA